jgi:hypothetical protein
MGPRRLITTLVVVVLGALMVPAPAYAAGELTVTVGDHTPKSNRVNVEITLKNNSGERLTVDFKRLPDGASAQVVIDPDGTRKKTVWLPCNRKSALEFTYTAGGVEQKPQVSVTTGACAAPASPGATPKASEEGDDDGNGGGFLDDLKTLGFGAAGVVIVLIVVLVLFLIVRRRLRG